MWIEYNPNPVKNLTRDCAIRAVAKALDTDWESAFAMLALNAFLMGETMDSDAVWASVLRQHGFYKGIVPDTCPDCYTVSDFCRDNPAGTFVLKADQHVICAVDGDYYDTWQSGQEPVSYYWYKKEDL